MSERPFRILVDVGGAFRGVHVLNQSGDDNARVIRHSSLGNRARLRPRGADGNEQLEIEVGGAWKGVHVRNQSNDDNSPLLRHSGDGNAVRSKPRGDGTHNLQVAVQADGLGWKGVHVDQQHAGDGTSLVRHSGDGNAVVFVPDAPVEIPSGDCHLLVGVSGVWKGVHIRDQSSSNGAGVVRHDGLGNVVRFTRVTESEDAWRMSVAVGDSFAGVHVLNQSGGDNVALIRHQGDGNLVRIVKNDDGTFHLLFRVEGDGTAWRGVHVQSQRDDNTTPLIRHQGNGNAFVLVPIPVPEQAKPTAPAEQPAPVAPSAPVVPDDLTIIEGIGPKISALLAAAGLVTFAQVAASTPAQLKAILTAGGNRFATADPTSWPEQARLAAAGDTAALKALQDKLTAGRI